MTRKTKYDTEFGALVSRSLTEARITQPDLAERLGKSTAYVNQTLTGRKKPSAEWADLVANTLKLTKEKRVELHRAAAKDNGFKLDLTKK
jgi:transcriptional regulator with XRE-family HTH domain